MNARPVLLGGEAYGIDVSSHQGPIDWQRVAKDNIAFTYIKASEGGDFTDARFNENWAAAAKAGLARGAYHFFTLCRSGRDQAENFLRAAAADSGALPPAVDLELIGNCARRPQPATVSSELEAFLARVEVVWSRPVLLYVGDDWQERYPVRAPPARPRWLKDTGRPAPPWAVWQVRALTTIAGVRGRVDLDIGRLEDLTAAQP